MRYHHSKNHNDSPAGYLRGPAAESGLVRLSFTAPPEASFNDVQADALVISPDGAKLVFTARNAEGNCLLWVRSLDSSDAKPLPGTDDAIGPFWSPDSRSVAFVSRGKLKRVDLAGGNIQQLCDAPRLTGGTWNAQGVILFGPDYQSSLSGAPRPHRRHQTFRRPADIAPPSSPLSAVSGSPPRRMARTRPTRTWWTGSWQAYPGPVSEASDECLSRRPMN